MTRRELHRTAWMAGAFFRQVRLMSIIAYRDDHYPLRFAREGESSVLANGNWDGFYLFHAHRPGALDRANARD